MTGERRGPGELVADDAPAARLREVRAAHRLLSDARADAAGFAPPVGDPMAIELPDDVRPPAVDLPTALSRRRSWYSYRGEPLDRRDLAGLLRWSAGPQRTVRLPDGRTRLMSTAPAAGGLPSIDVYVSVLRAGDLPLGVFRWDRAADRLDSVWTGDPGPPWRPVLAQPEFVDRAPVILALVARLDATLVKYPARHYRTVHVDAGIVLQNLYLTATGLGLAGCAVTGFDDAAAAAVLGLGDWAFVAVLFCVGRPGRAYPDGR